jgi:hypothetical protein
MRKKTNRRSFLKHGALIIPTLSIFVPRSKGAFYYAAAAAGGGPCTTPQDASSGADNSGVTNQEFDWYGSDFTAAATTTICAADLIMEKDGTPPASNLTVAIYSATGTPGDPGTQQGTASDAVSIATLSLTPATVSFVNMSASITSGTRYFVVLKFSARGTAGNVGVWRTWDPTDATHEIAYSDTGGASWGGELGDNWGKFQLYST